jgi:ubiquinone/menaquinone biosynthesis C-methylase UbiE
MGPHQAQRTLAQLSNVVPPVPQLYESVWRKRSLSLLSRRPFSIADELAELSEALKPSTGRVMIDVACSEGLYARHLAAAGSPVLAVDHSLAFLRRTALRSRELPVVPVRALAQHLPFVEGAAEGVAIGGSLNEIGDQRAAIAESSRVLKPGGAWFSMHLRPVSTGLGRVAQLLARGGGVTFPSSSTVDSWLRDSGLIEQSAVHTGVVSRVSANKQ